MKIIGTEFLQPNETEIYRSKDTGRLLTPAGDLRKIERK